MHPAASVILFTTLTGLGYGLMIWLGVALLSGELVNHTMMVISMVIASFVLTTVGLISSLFHLGHPERAWRALSQWKTSWLSREGVLAILCYIPMFMLAIAMYFEQTPYVSLLSVVLIVLCASTTYATSMIYASLKPIPAWSNPSTIFCYQLNALATGGVLFMFFCYFFMALPPFLNELLVVLTVALAVKIWWFLSIERSNVSDAQSAIGLKGTIRQIDPPHSSANYLMKEMGFEIARNNRVKYRLVSIFGVFLIPFACVYLGVNTPLIIVAQLFSIVGIVAERYLFFAEAKHVVTLYYRP